MKKLKRWLGPGLWLAGIPVIALTEPPWSGLAFMPALMLQFYEWGHHNGWMEGFTQCDKLNRPFMELDQRRIIELTMKLVEKETQQ